MDKIGRDREKKVSAEVSEIEESDSLLFGERESEGKLKGK